MSVLSRERKPLNPVSVTGRFLKRPIWPCQILRDGCPGVLTIDGLPYLCSVIGERRDASVTHGFRLAKHDGTTYEIDTCTSWGQWECSCGDGTFRGERPGGCRHIVALRQALAEKGGAA